MAPVIDSKIYKRSVFSPILILFSEELVISSIKGMYEFVMSSKVNNLDVIVLAFFHFSPSANINPYPKRRSVRVEPKVDFT